MIVIRDQQLRLLVLAQLIRELERSAHDKTPPPAGFTEKQLDELRALSSDELVRLSEMTEPRVAIQIDAGSLEHGLRQVDYLTKRSRQLEYFIRHPNQVLTGQQIADHVWSYDFDGLTNRVAVYVSYLRRKLEDPGSPSPIETVHGVGYRLVVPGSPAPEPTA